MTESSRLEHARALVAQGRIGEAESEFRAILQAAPAHPEASNVLAVGAMGRGDHAQALELLRACAERHPDDASTWHNMGLALQAASDLPRASAAFDRAVGLAPDAHVSWLHRAGALELLGRAQDAAHSYLRALRLAQGKGRWRGPETTPPALRGQVEHAIAFVRSAQHTLMQQLLEAVRQRYEGDFRRVEACIESYVGIRPAASPDPRQRPSFLYFPGLPARPYFDRAALPWLQEWEAQTAAIRDECEALVAGGPGERVFASDALARQNLRNDRGVAKWDGFYFYRHGEKRADTANRCPRTSASIERLPLARVRGNAPEVMFSVLTPGTHLLPHRGVTNTRLVAHLPLIVPPGCALNVAGEQHVWREGQAVVFDDTYEHEAWNRGEATRVILIADVWHPDLSAGERAAVAEIAAAISDFNKASAVPAGL